jgi:hypothetical protein
MELAEPPGSAADGSYPAQPSLLVREARMAAKALGS